jgi:ABC-type phosphate transport system substrate-binding protein
MRASSPLTAERGRIRAVVVALCAVAAVAVAVSAPSAAHAEFSEALSKPCTGSAVEGEGSSAQKVAQLNVWIPITFSAFCEAHGHSAPAVTYASDGSGCGLTAMGAGGATTGCTYESSKQEVAGSRNAVTRFGGSDAPPTPTQKANMESSTGEHPGKLHVLPVTSFAVAAVVHFPQGCKLEDPEQVGGNKNTTTGKPNDPAGAETGDKFSKGTLRVHIEAKTLEEIWSGTVTTWGKVLEREGVVRLHNEGKDKPTAKLEEEEGITECKNVPVRRVVRKDGSGTTYNFKAYLSLLPGAVVAGKNLWKEAPVVGDNTNWPLSAGGEKTAPPEVGVTNVCNATTSPHLICRGPENGGGGVAKVVEATDGSIGYLDLATAHQKNFTITPEVEDVDYWIPLQTVNPKEVEEGKPGIGTNYVEPSQNPLLNLSTEGEGAGANCTNADYRGYPSTEADPTLGDWSQAIGTGSLDTKSYPACGLTYDFAWDDDSTVYGNTEAEEKQARTVKDYLTALTSVEGQTEVLAVNYGKLPTAIQTIARKGVEAIGWHKTTGGVTEKPPVEEKHEQTGGGTAGGGSTNTVVTPPSNAFSVAGTKIKGKSVVLSLVLPGAGKVQIKATGGGVTVANVTASVGGGQGTVTLPISGAAQKKLAKVKGHKLSVKITVTFTPAGGTAASQTKTITITQASITPKKKKGKKKG